MTIQRAVASASDTLDQTTWAQVDSMTLIPGAGDFLVTFSMDVTYNSSPGSQTLKVAVYVDGVQQQHSIRTIQQNSSLPSMSIGVVTSAYVSPGAGEVVEVRYIASSATAPMAGTTRELTLLPAEQTNYQDTDVVNDTIASGTWATLDTMTRTPGAGDYLLVFTTSASTIADEDVAFRLSVGGSPVAHTERQLSVEGSADPSSYCVLIAASISPNGSQVVEIEWARITGTGTQTCYERNMILIEVDSADISQATGTVDDTESTSGTDKQIDDMLITDPGANDYLVLFSSHRHYGALGAPGAITTIKIYEGGAEDTNLTRIWEHEDSVDATVMPVFTTGRVTLGVSTDDIQAYWRGDTTDVRTMYERTLVAVADPSPVATPQAGWVFGKADTEISLTNTSYAEKLTLEFNAPAAGDYLIVVSAQVSSSGTNISIGVRAQLDDTTTIMEALIEPTNTDRGLNYRNVATVYLAESLASGDHYVDLDAFVEGGTGYMQYMKIAVIRLDDYLPTSGMYDYAATEGEATPGTSWGTQQTLTFTPDTAGDYLVLASAELKVGSNTRTINARLNYDSAAEYLPVNNSEESGNNYVGYESKDTSDYLAFVWGGIVNIPASSKTILLEAIATSGTTMRIRKRRIIAIRIAAMDSSAITDEDPANTSTSSAWVEKSTVTFTPGSTSDYLLFGGIVVKPDGPSQLGVGRLEQTAGTGTGTIGELRAVSKDIANPADCIPMLTVEIKSLTNTSQTIKTQYGASGTTHYGKGSFVIAIRKPVAGPTTEDITRLSSVDVVRGEEPTRRSSVDVTIVEDFTRASEVMVATGGELTRESRLAVAVIDEPTRASEVDVFTSIAAEYTRESRVSVTIVPGETRAAEVYVATIDEPTRASELAVAVTTEYTRESRLAVAVIAEYTRRSEVRVPFTVEPTRVSEVYVAVEEEPTRASEVYVIGAVEFTRESRLAVAVIDELTRASEVYVAVIDEYTRESRVTVVVGDEPTRASELAVAVTDEYTRLALVSVAGPEDVTRASEVAVALITEYTRESRVTVVVVGDVTRGSEVAIVIVPEPTRESRVTVVVELDLTRASEVHVAVEVEPTRASEVAVAVIEDYTRESRVAVVIVDEPTRSSVVFVPQVLEFTRQSVVYVVITAEPTRRALVTVSGGGDDTRESRVTVIVVPDPNRAVIVYVATTGEPIRESRVFVSTGVPLIIKSRTSEKMAHDSDVTEKGAVKSVLTEEY